MSLLRKSDVKNHLSPHFRTELYPCPPESKTDATSFSLAEPDIADRSLTAFAVDFIEEHSFSETFLAGADPVTNTVRFQAPTISKSAQA